MVRYLPVLGELFSSDMIVYFLFCIAVALLNGLRYARDRNIEWIAGCVIVYTACELLSDFTHSYLLEILLLFIGTIALGGVIGFVLAPVISRVRNR